NNVIINRLVQVLSEWEIPKMSVSALYPQHRQLSPRVRVFVAWLSELYTGYFANFEYPQK
ncbi:TPA: LysR family transcriptional regulator, partial [Acinetobacter baumannii]